MENLPDENNSVQEEEEEEEKEEEKEGREEFSNMVKEKHIEKETAEEINDIVNGEIVEEKFFDISPRMGEEMEQFSKHVSNDECGKNETDSPKSAKLINDEIKELDKPEEVKKLGKKKKKLKKFKNIVNKKRKGEHSSNEEKSAENELEKEIENEVEKEIDNEVEKKKEENEEKANMLETTSSKKKKKRKILNDSYMANEFIDDVAEEKEDSEDNEISEKEQVYTSNEDLNNTEHFDENKKAKGNSKINTPPMNSPKKVIVNKINDNIDELYFDERRSEVERSDAERSETNKLKKKKTHFDEILENLKLSKKKKKNLSDDDCLQYCESVLKQMIYAHEQDVKSIKENKPATAKLQMVDNICKILIKPKWKPYFMKLNINRVLEMWLMPLTKNSLPHFSIRCNILKVIMQLPFTIKSLRGSQLGKVLIYLHTHKDETEENKKMIKSILQNLLGPILGINANYKHSLKKRQKKIMENPNFHKIILEKAKTLIPEKISIEKEEEQNECKRHVTVPFNSECSFLINVASTAPNDNKKIQPKSKSKRLADNFNLVNRMKKSQTVSIDGKEIVPAP